MEIGKDGKRFRLRSQTADTAGKVFQAAGVALLPTVRRIACNGPWPTAVGTPGLVPTTSFQPVSFYE